MTQKSKNIFIIIASVITLLVVGYFAFAYTSKQAWPFQQAATQQQENSDGINYDPPTEQEAEASQDGKVNSGAQENQTAPTNVSVGIAFAGYDDSEGVIDVRAFTPDIIEGDGTCTATLTLNGQTVEKTSKAFIDSSSSQCEPIQIPLSSFPASGTWNLIVTYESASHKGTSASVEVEVAK